LSETSGFGGRYPAPSNVKPPLIFSFKNLKMPSFYDTVGVIDRETKVYKYTEQSHCRLYSANVQVESLFVVKL